MSQDGFAEPDEFIEQIVFEHVPGKGVVPERFTMSVEDLEKYLHGMSLDKHVAASSEMPYGGNLFYRQFGTDDRWAMLIYRESAPRQRFTSRAHVLIASSNALTPLAAVAMWDWPWPMEAIDGELPALTYRALSDHVEEISGSWRVTPTSATYRLLIELVCHGEDLAVKIRPELRKDLLIAVAKHAPASLRKGFSVHETRYDTAQKSLPRLCFISEEQGRSGFDIRRRVIDLDTVESGQGSLSIVAPELATAYRKSGAKGVAAVLDQTLSGHEEPIRELLNRWDVPTFSPGPAAAAPLPLDPWVPAPSDSDDKAFVQDDEVADGSIPTPAEEFQQPSDEPGALSASAQGMLTPTVLPSDTDISDPPSPAWKQPSPDAGPVSGEPVGCGEAVHTPMSSDAPDNAARPAVLPAQHATTPPQHATPPPQSGAQPGVGPVPTRTGQAGPRGPRQAGNLYLVVYVEMMVVAMLLAVAVLLSGSR